MMHIRYFVQYLTLPRFPVGTYYIENADHTCPVGSLTTHLAPY